MKISFAPLATLTVNHGYYKTACSDFEFVPTARSRELMVAGRVLARVIDGRLHLVHEVDSAGAAINSIAGETLFLGMRLLNTQFGNVTEPVLSDSALTPFFANATQPEKINAPHGIALVAGRYAHAPTLPQRPVTLSLQTSKSEKVNERLLTEEATSYDFRGLPAGVYFIHEDYGNGLLKTRPFLIDTELRNMGVWAVLALQLDAAFYQTAPSFTLDFKARTEKRRYYVVASNWSAAEFNQLNAVEAGFAADGRTQIQFEGSPDPSLS